MHGGIGYDGDAMGIKDVKSSLKIRFQAAFFVYYDCFV